MCLPLVCGVADANREPGSSEWCADAGSLVCKQVVQVVDAQDVRPHQTSASTTWKLVSCSASRALHRAHAGSLARPSRQRRPASGVADEEDDERGGQRGSAFQGVAIVEHSAQDGLQQPKGMNGLHYEVTMKLAVRTGI